MIYHYVISIIQSRVYIYSNEHFGLCKVYHAAVQGVIHHTIPVRTLFRDIVG